MLLKAKVSVWLFVFEYFSVRFDPLFVHVKSCKKTNCKATSLKSVFLPFKREGFGVYLEFSYGATSC